MKKLVFAVQVFGIIALFPIYLILEMNHGTVRLPENKNPPVVKEKVEKNIIQSSLNAESQNENSRSGKILEGPAAPIARNVIVKDLIKLAYNAY